MISDIEDFFTKGCGRCSRFATADCSVQQWREGLGVLRRLCRATGLEETVKWGHPCYTSAGRNIVILGAFRDNFRLTFFNASLMKDEARILEKQGPNTRSADMIHFTSNDGPTGMEATIKAYLAEAISYARDGIVPPKHTAEIDLPAELVDALDADPDLAEAFAALTPGRQRSYVIALNSAKASATRMARIAKFREKILAGKGANEMEANKR